MRLRNISRYLSASLAAVLFMGIAITAQAHQPGLSHIDQQGKKTLRNSAAAATGEKTPITSPAPAYREGEVLVKVKESAARKDEKELAKDLGGEKARKLHSDKAGPRLYKLKLKPGDTVEKKIKELKSHPDVESVQPNYIYQIEQMPNDPLFNRQWEMYNTGQTIEGMLGTAGADMRMTAAWSITTGSKDIVVAVIDTGIDFYNPDLVDNLWVNPSPGSYDPTNYSNDVHGINPLAFDPPPLDVNNNPIPWPYTASDSSDPYDDYGHGTHVSGTIGAKGGNAAGVTGINWNVGIMALKGLAYNGMGSDADLIECIDYAAFEKSLYDSNHLDGANVRVINASWGGPPNSSDQLLQDAITQAGTYDILFVAAAGNNGTNNDITKMYPASFANSTNNIIAVAATNNNDNLARFSNYGHSVAVAAPGVFIMSTLPVRQRVYFDDFEHGMSWNGIPWVPGGYYINPIDGSPGAPYSAWALTAESYFSPTRSLTDSPGGLYQSNTDTWAKWGPLDLSAETGSLKLEYRLKLNTELYFDGMLVDVSPNGSGSPSSWPAVDGFTGTTPGYEYLTTDITPLAGSSTVYVAFELITDSTVNANGAHIDDVAVTRRPTTVQPAGNYWYDTGTSMAAPHVAGLAALMLAANPDLTTSQLKDKIISSVNPLPSLTGKVASGGRVNGAKAVAAAVGNRLLLAAPSQVGGSTVMTATFTYGGAVQCGRSINFYQDGVLIGTALTGGYPSATPGIATLRVNGKAGDHTAYAASVAAIGVPSTRSNDVTYHTYPPAIDTVNPTNASVGSTITVTGSHFCPTKGTVYFTSGGTATAVVPITWSDTSLTFKVPAIAAGPYALTVRNYAMASASTTFDIQPPAITTLSQSTAGPGMTVTINGTDFGTVTGTISLKSSLGVVTAVTPLTWTDTAITFKVPGIKADPVYQLTVKNAAASSSQTFTIPPPAITTLSQSTAGPGLVVTITGTGFGMTKGSVLLTTTTGTIVTTIVTPTAWTDTSATFTVPGLAAKTYNLTVRNAAGTSASTPFTIPPPAITTLSQSTAGPGLVVTITGTGFGLVKGSVLLSFTSAGIVTTTIVTPTAWTDTSATFTVPGIAARTYNLAVKNAAGRSASTPFIIPPPAITTLSQSTAGPGIAVTITGTGFGMTKGSVLMSFTSAGIVTTTTVTPTAWLDTSVTFNVPGLAARTYNLAVRNAAGKSGTTTLTIPLPVPTGVSTPSAIRGTIGVIITGSYFGAVKGTVLFKTATGVLAATVTPTAWSDGSITFTVPAIAATAYKLSVHDLAGTSTSPGLDFTITP